MNAITDYDAESSARASAAQPPGERFTLRRTGRKPVRFTGWKMVEAQGAPGGAKLYYDLTVYRTSAAHFVAELIARRNLLDAADLCRVESFASLTELADWLENFACAQDVPVRPGLNAPDLPLALAMLQAVHLRDVIALVGEDYQDLLSDVFEALDLTDAPSASPARGVAQAA